MSGAIARLIVPTIILLSAVVMAQDQPAREIYNQPQPIDNPPESRFELFGGYSYEHIAPCGNKPGGCGLETGDLATLPHNSNGWTVAATYYFSKQLGITADFAGHYFTQRQVGAQGVSYSRVSYMFGPVFPIRPGQWEKANPFAHALFGVVHQGVFSTNGLSTALGGGLDIKLSEHLAIRVAQVDYEFNMVPKISASAITGHTNGFRYAGGIVIK